MAGALRDFLAMGGYGAFVWASYLLSALVLGGLFLLSRHSLRTSGRELERLREAAERRRGRPLESARSDERRGDGA